MSKKICLNRRSASIALLTLIFIWTAWYIKNHADEFKAISNLSWKGAVLLLFLSLTGVFLRGLFTKILVVDFGVKLKFKQWFGIMVVTSFGNHIFPFSGIGLRATYLKRMHNFPYAHFLSTLMATYLVEFLIYSFLGFASLVCIYFYYDVFNIILLVFYLTLGLCCSGFIFFKLKVPWLKGRFAYHFDRMLDGWERLKSHSRLMLNLSVIIVFRTIVLILAVLVSFWAYGYEINIFAATLIATLIGVSVLLRITPGALGIQEGVFVLTANIFGFTLAQGMLVAGLIRLISLLWVFTLGPLFSYLLINEQVEGKSL